MAKDHGFSRIDTHPSATWTVPAAYGSVEITALADPDTPSQRDPLPEQKDAFPRWRHPMPTRFDLNVGSEKKGAVRLEMSFQEALALYHALGDVLQWDGQ